MEMIELVDFEFMTIKIEIVWNLFDVNRIHYLDIMETLNKKYFHTSFWIENVQGQNMLSIVLFYSILLPENVSESNLEVLPILEI